MSFDAIAIAPTRKSKRTRKKKKREVIMISECSTHLEDLNQLLVPNCAQGLNSSGRLSVFSRQFMHHSCNSIELQLNFN